MPISPSIMTTYGRIDIAFTHGEGSFLISEDGKRYLDYASGIAVNAFGHCHPKLVEALQDQASKLWHTSNLYRIPEQETVAEKLVANSCADRVFFCNSGAEATEGAVKVARRYAWANGDKDRTEIICATGAFHGRTLAMLAANDRPLFREGFGPSAQGFTHVEWGDIENLKKNIGKHVAAILVEPVQGEGGARKAPPGYLKSLQEIAKQNGSLLISDEVQIGMGRSGSLFAYQQEGIEPDIIALAKGLGGGFPVGAVLARANVGDAMIPGTHGSTFGGNPLAMRSANAVLDLLLENNFLDDLKKMVTYFDKKMDELLKHDLQNSPILVHKKGSGMLRGFQLDEKVTAGNFGNVARDKGLLLVGAAENTIRLLPPLNTSKEEVDKAFDILKNVIIEMKTK
ncbi:aspartate aminotransferase family protein [Alphaproteobacteria bacterium]|jgi:acetylornithine/N-succinyldiaminopimelate aminotransferase|nr:aspartate aminotransferase family protein [Alphaproteobacteria bacterium]MDB2478935.1 aspartate aminotransferase family protein [Alphaproteobacteria bacterium]MDB2583033.1 aspartate aminotransferase family protein [Alphaproteobacteria bacterium]MDB3916284.1 aspartate aminotransferase family protein [Alphaproteobacteria bacterium]MDC6452058.1 aspartate aminotransferase family protein [Alphaproteobacteria bacterium]